MNEPISKLTYIICLYVALVITPYFYSYYLFETLIVGVLAFFLSFGHHFKSVNRFSIVTVTYVYFAVELLYKSLGISTASWGYFGNKALIVITLWLVMYIITRCNTREQHFIGKLTIIVMIINIISGIVIMTLIPELNVTLKQSDYYSSQYGMLNVGGTDFSYSVYFLSLPLFGFIVNNKKPLFKSFSGLLFILCLVYLIWFGDSATIILTLFLSVYIVYTIDKQIKSRIKIVIALRIILAIGGLYIVFITFSDSIIGFVSDISGEKVARRFETILHFSQNTVNYDDKSILARFNMIGFDFQVWLESFNNFIKGVGFHRGEADTVLEAMVVNRVGGHSDIFDTITEYGCFGLFIVIMLLGSVSRYFKSIYSADYNIYISYIIAIIISSSLNVILFPHIIFSIFFFGFYYSKISTINHN